MSQQISGGNRLLDAQFILNKVGLTPGMKVADFGCGSTGHFVLPAAQLVTDAGVVYAVDILESVLEGVKGRAKFQGITNIEYVWSDLETVGGANIPEESLDAVLLINIMLHIKPLENIVREASRLLKPGGKILVVEWKSSGGPAFSPPPEKRLRKEKVREVTQGLKLDELEEFEAGEFHYGMIFKKV